MHLISYISLILPIVFARFCVHDEKGWCRGHDIWGWCFHNKTSGAFDCDDAGYCASQDQLKNKKSSGCFQRANSSVCCCNDADGCNLGFIPMQPKYAAGQQCMNTVEEPGEDPKTFRPCDDPFCYALLSSEAEGGLTTVVRGCYSRKMVMHNMYKAEDDLYHNNTNWQSTEHLAKQPTCADILWDEPKYNNTVSLCFDYTFTQEEEGEEIEMKGKLCCCKGTNRCNERFMWGHEAIGMAELKEKLSRRENPSTSSDVGVVVGLLSLLICRFTVDVVY